MQRSTSGVALLGRLLKELTESPARTAAALARALDAPRSSVFACVRLMELENFVERDGFHRVLPGAEAARLGFAFHGIGRLQRSAAPLLTALRDDTNASVDLIVASQAAANPIVRRRARWDSGRSAGSGPIGNPSIEIQIQAGCEGRRVLLQVRVHQGTTKEELRAVQTCVERAAEALRREFRSDAV